MHKLNENNETVSYKFETSGAYGYCEFHKESEKFILDREKTHPHFFENPYYEGVNYEAFKVWMKLVKQKMNGEGFPDLLGICC